MLFVVLGSTLSVLAFFLACTDINLPPTTPASNELPEGQVDYLLPEIDHGRPEAVAVRTVGQAGSDSSAFVIVFNAPVYAETARLEVIHTDGSESYLDLQTMTSPVNTSQVLEFGPVGEDLVRAYGLDRSSQIYDHEGNCLQNHPGRLVTHPNSVFIGTDFWPDGRDQRLSRCAGILGLNKVSPIVLKSLMEVDSTELTDTERYQWLTTIMNELDDADWEVDRVTTNPTQPIVQQLIDHPCSPLWSEEVNEENADKRNDPGGCNAEGMELLKHSYISLGDADRVALTSELHRLAVFNRYSEQCQRYWPQLFVGMWVPLEE